MNKDTQQIIEFESPACSALKVDRILYCSFSVPSPRQTNKTYAEDCAKIGDAHINVLYAHL